MSFNECNFEGYCDRQNMTNAKVCLAKTGSCDYQNHKEKVCPACGCYLNDGHAYGYPSNDSK